MSPAPAHPARAPRWSDSAGEWSLVLSVIAVVCTLVPVIGDWLTLPFAIGAVALGFVGLRANRTGRAWRSLVSMLGVVLGAAAIAVVVVLALATHAW